MKKKGNNRMPTSKQKLIHNPVRTSLFVVCLCKHTFSNCASNNNRYISERKKERCRDGVMNEFLFWCRHPVVSLLFLAN